MRKTIIDISEMSDSKEVYGQRPNPAISWFIYCLVALLVTWPMYWYTEARRREGLLLGVFFEIIFVTRFLLEFIKNDQEAFEEGYLLNMGQLLSIPFIILGLFLIIRAYKRPLSPVVDKQPESLDPKYREKNDKK